MIFSTLNSPGIRIVHIRINRDPRVHLTWHPYLTAGVVVLDVGLQVVVHVAAGYEVGVDEDGERRVRVVQRHVPHVVDRVQPLQLTEKYVQC